MTSRKNLIRSVALAAVVLFVVPSLAQANTRRHPVAGSNLRFQIGGGLPIPITGTAPPNGRVLPTASAMLTQSTGGNITILPGQFTAPGNPVNQPTFLANTSVFQVLTAITIQWPAAKAQFQAGGRTGADTVTFCAGDTVTASGNPACPGPGDAGNAINGLMRYTRTDNELGGVARGALGGFADVAVRVNAAAPCAAGAGGSLNPACQVIFALATPAGTGAQGAAFGVIVGTSGAGPADGRFYMSVSAAGAIQTIQSTNPLGPGLPNPATSYGGPWTGGQLTISVTENVGATSEVFIISGSDNRTVNGAGTLSMVSGSVSDRTLTGPNANRGWMNLTIGKGVGSAPALSPHAMGAVMGMLALAGFYVARRRS
jgi:hypothetical protein